MAVGSGAVVGGACVGSGGASVAAGPQAESASASAAIKANNIYDGRAFLIFFSSQKIWVGWGKSPFSFDDITKMQGEQVYLRNHNRKLKTG
jgi:hypothetical protein